jgi:hypothetical protein
LFITKKSPKTYTLNSNLSDKTIYPKDANIPKPVWAVGFALEQALHVVALAVFSFLILKRLQHK